MNKVILFFVVGFLSLTSITSPVASAQQTKQSFTVADEIGLAHFGDPYTLKAEMVHFSPDGTYFAVDTELGRLDLNRVEDSLRFYRTRDAKDFLTGPSETPAPSPVWVVNRLDNEGPVIHSWRWAGNSGGVAFLERASGGNQQLVFADLRRKKIERLTSSTQDVKAFDVRDEQHYVYTAVDIIGLQNNSEQQQPAIVGTGRRLFDLIFPKDPSTLPVLSDPSAYLWAVLGGKRFEPKHNGAPLAVDGDIALSPDKNEIVAKFLVAEVPLSWQDEYPPPFASDPYRTWSGGRRHQYVRIDLQSGALQALTDAPVSVDVGSWAYAVERPSWSSDGQEVLLPGTFVNSSDHPLSRPCIAVVNFPIRRRACVEVLKGRTPAGFEDGYHDITRTEFLGGDKQCVVVSSWDPARDWAVTTTEYLGSADSTWRVVREVDGDFQVGPGGIELTVRQGLDQPPLLVARHKRLSRSIWNPNPKLDIIELGQADIYTWIDKQGRNWKGGLYKPTDYHSGERYPLVIQTHDFSPSEFRPSGIFPTAFAARALAAAGIMVLQVGEHCHGPTPEEGPCAASGYEAAANKLISEGLVDPGKIGIIGFSYSGFYVLQALALGSLHAKAALLADSTLGSYSQYILYPEHFASEADARMGAPPFGEGLQQWLKRSPGFNLNKVTAPVLVVGNGPAGLLVMWDLYASLRYLQKPVDVVMLNTDEHILTNPAVRMASQGGSVEWFRFWLQGYEDPNPAKAEQYARWRGLKKLQEENTSKR